MPWRWPIVVLVVVLIVVVVLALTGHLHLGASFGVG